MYNSRVDGYPEAKPRENPERVSYAKPNLSLVLGMLVGCVANDTSSTMEVVRILYFIVLTY